MGLSVALSELLMQKQLQTEYSYMLMMANDRRMTISDKLSEEISDYNDLQEYENQCIQLDFESDTKDLDTSSDEYKQRYQEFLQEKNEISEKYERLINETQRELDRKEQAADMEKEQIETQLEAVNANIESMSQLVEKNAKDDFSILQ